MAVMTPAQTQKVRDWATANGLNPLVQINHAEDLLQSGAYPSFNALAEQAQFNRGRELTAQANTQTQPQSTAFNAQPIDAQTEGIRGWFAQNQNATQAQIQGAMDQYGVSADTVAKAMGNTRLPNAPAAIQVAQYQNITGNRGDINDINRAIVARNLGVSAEELSAFGGMTPAQAQALTARAAEQNPLGGQVSTDQIRAYLAANPSMSDQQLSAMMTQYGVTPTQVSQATGVDVGTINQRLGSAVQAGAEDIPTGLAGYEQALTSGLATARGTLQGAETAARGDLDPAMEEVARLYGLNVEDLRQAQVNAQGSLGSAIEAGRGLFNQNIAGLESAGQVARGDIERTYGQAGQLFNPYQQAGTTALQQQLALSGALGQDAFNQAYQESPYVRFLREQGERSTLSGAAATGGLGGGRVQQELVRFGQGLASQGLQQQFQNLSGLSGMGMQAAGSGADLLTGMGTNLANLGVGTAQNIATQRGALSDLESQYGTNMANLYTGTAQNIAGQRQNLAGERSQYGANLANLATSTGTNIANLQAQAAQNIATQRGRAGEMLAGQIGDTTLNLANLGASQGSNLANLLSQYGTAGLNLSQRYTADQIAAMQQAAQEEASSQQGLAINQASALAGQPFAQAQPFSYGQAFGNALQAGALGYDLGGGSGQQAQGAEFMQGISPSRRMVQGGGQQIPQGYMNYGTGQPFNVFSNNMLAARLGGRG